MTVLVWANHVFHRMPLTSNGNSMTSSVAAISAPSLSCEFSSSSDTIVLVETMESMHIRIGCQSWIAQWCFASQTFLSK